VKGGGLAPASRGAPIISLILSDVIGDCLDVIASGPTVDSISRLRAVDVLNRFDSLRNELPPEIWSVVETKTKRIRKIDQELDVSNFIVGNIETALKAAREKASELGYTVEAVTVSGNEGDAGEVGKEIAGQILHLANRAGKVCCLAGGEPTVSLCDNPGQGGRNQHLVLSLISAILPSVGELSGAFCLLSGGTDGEDGNVSVAGAVVDSDSIRHLSRSAKQIKCEVSESLRRCDSHSFLSKYDLVFRVPRTFTNVCDLRVLLVANGGESASSTIKMA
jgi:glycerate-2-kinase